MTLSCEQQKRGKLRLLVIFACVGEGSYLAHASLMRRNYIDVKAFGEALYLVFEAKKAAEAVNSVGPDTLISVMSIDGSRRVFDTTKIDYLEDLYKRYGPQPIPDEVVIPEGLFY